MGTREQYRRSAQLVRRALEIFPDEPAFLNTLGVALYRAGEFRDAADTLDRSSRLARAAGRSPFPEDALFLAPSRHRLGDEQGCRAQLDVLRGLLPETVDPTSELAAFLDEAEEELGPVRRAMMRLCPGGPPGWERDTLVSESRRPGPNMPKRHDRA